MCCNAITDIVQFIVNQGQRKRKIAATLLFICAGHCNFSQMTK